MPGYIIKVYPESNSRSFKSLSIQTKYVTNMALFNKNMRFRFCPTQIVGFKVGMALAHYKNKDSV